jgi:hypothetical protein
MIGTSWAQNVVVGDGVLSDVHQEFPARRIPRCACAQCIGVQNQVNVTGNFNGDAVLGATDNDLWPAD